MEKILLLQQVAEELGCSYRKARDLVHSGHLRRMPGFKRPMKVSAIELDRYMKGKAVGA